MAPPNPDPIVFEVPDMSIKVFGQLFHVNSDNLRVHSEFFRKFLDSPDKCITPPSTPSVKAGTFKYEWVTQVDPDGSGWTLTSKGKTQAHKPYKGKREMQIEAFKILLYAVNCRSLTIVSSVQLCLVVKLADFYRMLPAVCTAFHGVFYGNPKLVAAIPNDCVELLEASYKLRNKLLFRECFVHVMGPVSNPRFKQLQNEELKVLAQSRWSGLQETILDIQLQILQGEINEPSLAAHLLQIKRGMIREPQSQKPKIPLFYRNAHTGLAKTAISGSPDSTIRKLLEPLLKNKLVLDRSGVQAGEGLYNDSFLFFELNDKDLPWDVKQRVW